MMSKTAAAYEILKEFKKPMTYKEIIDIALSRNMISTKGATPAQTLRADIYNENKRRDNSNRKKRFLRLENGYVDLIKE